MSAVTALPPVRTDILRPASKGVGARIFAWGLAHVGLVFAVLRRIWPIAVARGSALVTRYDDVREVFLADADFLVPYTGKLDVIMGGEPFFLGMGDTAAYRRDTGAMRSVVRIADIDPRLTTATTARAEALVEAALAEAGGRIEVVDQLARNVTFDVLCPYFGISDTPDAALRVWATRLFEFQFADPSGERALRNEVDVMAPALRAHVDGLMAARREAGSGPDDVLGRCLDAQAAGIDGFSDAQIRSALIGFLVGGLPQPPMVVPQALEQLLRRPDALAGAQKAARDGDDVLLAGFIFEALRFDPLAPALFRETARDHVVAAGTRRQTSIPRGTRMLVSFASAMMDPRRVQDPGVFQPRRPASDFMHFGQGLHTCFGLAINHALLPLMLKPLLRRSGLRRDPGPDGAAHQAWCLCGQPVGSVRLTAASPGYHHGRVKQPERVCLWELHQF